MTIELEPGSLRPSRSTHARRLGEVARTDASVTIGEVLRAVRRGDVHEAPLQFLRGALRARAAEGDQASGIVADRTDRGLLAEETP